MTGTSHRARMRQAAIASTSMLLLSLVPFVVHADQTTHQTDTISVVSRTDGHPVLMNVHGRGERCWAATSRDNSVGISMGDDLCSLTDESTSDASSLRARLEPARVLFSLGDTSYVITDPAAVSRARQIFAPLMAKADEQGALGGQQRQIGEQERGFGRQQRDVQLKGLDTRELDRELDHLSTELKKASQSGATQEELGALQGELAGLQGELATWQARLGDQQALLGERMSALEHQAEQLAKTAADDLRTLLASDIRSGLAKPR